MTAKPITPTLSVSEQVLSQDVAALATAGFKSIICNRPDGEGADQPSFAEIEAAALKAEKVLPFLAGKTVKKVIVVPRKMVNVVVV